MDNKYDKKTAKLLFEALDRAKAYRNQLQEKREKKIYKEIKIPCYLSDVINGLTKEEMTAIRQNLELKNLSSLNKSELASELIKTIPLKFEKLVRMFDQNIFDLMKLIVKNSGLIPSNDMEFSKVVALMEYGIIFPGLKNNQRVLFMPVELTNLFNLLNITEIEKIASRNTEWIQLTQGMLHYYGVIDAWHLIKKVVKYTEQDVNVDDFIDVTSFACDYYKLMDITEDGYKDSRVLDTKLIINEHNKRPDVDYYPFTKIQLLKAGNPNFINTSLEMKKFINFLLINYDISEDDINKISMQLTSIINMESKPTLIIEYLQSCFEIPSFEYLQVLTAKTIELHNNTRQWTLKGHTPDELFQEEKKFLKPLPVQSFNTKPTKAKIIEMPKTSKIGRNDTCPCGSGKKYKKCCGK